jgi:hypothetical protein
MNKKRRFLIVKSGLRTQQLLCLQKGQVFMIKLYLNEEMRMYCGCVFNKEVNVEHFRGLFMPVLYAKDMLRQAK